MELALVAASALAAFGAAAAIAGIIRRKPAVARSVATRKQRRRR
ncbi:MAG: hypothetical protein ACRD2J_04070 [Thermoanaerobaculia bacterium]